jgi:hypothetical protein
VPLIRSAEITTLLLLEMSIIPEVQTPSTCAVKLAFNWLFCTENVPGPGKVVVQLVAPVSEVIPLAKVKSSSQKAVAVPAAATVTDCDAVQPLAGLVTVTV